ncbi:MAG: hypothetical protein CL827_08310 [Crocinitomicaceae bacterium]|nr:hypothetical protein [Crocinitomicaceae bacterium]|tara:strand:+ start:1743 stop:2939 length:1197 start_codon:yes stop_codon:yes gene_type:complete
MEVLIIILLITLLGAVIFFNTRKKEDNNPIALNIEEEKFKITDLEKKVAGKEVELNTLKQNIEIAKTKLSSFHQIKLENAQLQERLKLIEWERNDLKNKNTRLVKDEETRNEMLRKSVASSNTLQESLEKERQRIIDDRLKEQAVNLAQQKQTWREHEKDVENHIQLICQNHVIKYVSQEDFPHSRNKPDNAIEIMDQLIIFDAKSPANDDLNNFSKYIKIQTESLKKYAKHDDVKKDLFLVIPSNTLSVIKKFSYNIGDYNVFIITKDALEPIILSLKKVEEYEFAETLSPDQRDNVCRIIGKFAHTTKRRIQIDQFFAEEFLDTLQKAKQLPSEILESVIAFENAEKLNPPVEKRKKPIITNDLKEKSLQIKKEIQIREIPEIQANIEFIDDEKSD